MKLDFKSDPETMDLMIINGDFVIGDNTDVQASVIAFSNKGEIRNAPLLGTNLRQYIGSSASDLEIVNALREDFESEDIFYTVVGVERDENDITINVE